MAKAIKNEVAPTATKAATPAAQVGTGTVDTVGVDAVVKSPFKVRELSLADADKAIQMIRSSGKALRTLAHETACGIMLHYAKHGDYTRLQAENDKAEGRLLEAINTAFSRSMGRAFADWTVRYTSLRYNEETKRFYHNKRDKRISEGQRGFFDMKAIDNPFYEFERDPVAPKAEDFDELLRRFIKRAETLLEQKTQGVKVGEKTVKVQHAIDDAMVLDLTDFALKHGVVVHQESASAQ